MVLVASAVALERDNVFEEVETFAKRHRPLIPIDVGGNVGALGKDHRANAYLEERLRFEENDGSQRLARGEPSPSAIEFLDESFGFVRVGRRRTLVLISLLALFADTALAGWSYFAERAAREQAQLQLARANQALAQSISNDLGLRPNEPLDARERQALWKLALADEAVKGDFVFILAKTPEETARVAPGFAQISRALGLLRPSPDEVASLVEPVIKQFGQTNEAPAFLVVPAVALQALTPKLSGAQASQALKILREQIGQTTNVISVWALAKGLQAVAPKLSPAQTSHAFEPLLERIGQTTNPNALQALGQALQAFAPKLAEGQASQAFELLLKQIGQTTNPSALQTLAKTLLALAARITRHAGEPRFRFLAEADRPEHRSPSVRADGRGAGPGAADFGG